MKSAFHPQGESQCPWLPLENDKWVPLYTKCKGHNKNSSWFLILDMKNKLIDFRYEKADYHP